MLSDTQRELLAARLRKGRAPAAGSIPPRPEGAAIPLSFGQEQLWFIDRFAPGLAIYNIATGLQLHGPLELPALTRAIAALTARHEPLRTRLVGGADGVPVQLIDPPGQAPVPLLDLSQYPVAERQQRLNTRAGELAAQPTRLDTGPLFRCELVRLDRAEHVLLTVVHHAVFDGWSFGVLLRELPALYAAELTGAAAELAPMPIQFADYAVWERKNLTGDGLDRLVSYWRDRLQSLPTVQLPTDRARPALESHRGGTVQHNLPVELLAGLRALAVQQNTTLFVTLLSGLFALLSRYTGQHDLVVGTPSANRSRPELAAMIGFLVNTLPIRVETTGDPSFTELMGRVREATVGAYSHQDIPFAKLVDALQVDRDASRTPVFQISFTQAETSPEPVQAGELAFEVYDGYPDPNNAKFDLAFFAGTSEHEFILTLQYASDLYDSATAQRMLAHLGAVLTGAVEDPDTALSELPLLTEAELYDELIGFNNTARPLAAASLPELFAQQAARTPAALAVLADDEQYSYAELAAATAAVAGWLARREVHPGDLVGVAMAPSARRLAVVLGILAAGAGYLPLDPALPPDRLAFMTSDAEARLVVADKPALDRLTGLDARVCCLDAQWPLDPAAGSAEPAAAVDPASVAYVIYTSGSTGRPKGVVVEHRQVANFARWMIEQWQVGVQDRVLQFASLNFDVSVLDMFTALLSGAAAVVADRDTVLSPPRLAELMRAHQVSLASMPPAVLSLLTDAELPALRLLISAGEELSSELALAWQRPGLRLVNGYGPTETTVLSAFCEIDGSLLRPPIGRPPANYQNYVLDPCGNPVPPGVVGELHTGGAGVTRGYLNRPELTEQRFIADPFSDEPGARLYRTGDLVKRLPDGNLAFLGRADGQVKLRGLRIELGEIETVLAGHPSVEQAVVVVRKSRAGVDELVGYYRGQASAAELRGQLASWLPAYMVPARLIPVERFELNSSGKVDRSRLPEPEPVLESTGSSATATQTEAALTAIVSRLVKQQAAVEDSFFDLGGNSLLAMQLVSAVRAELETDISVAEVFLSPTVRGLAARMDAVRANAAGSADGVPAAGGVLVELLAEQPADGVPLVLLHAVGGTVYSYAALAAELSGRFRVYGLQSPYLTGRIPDGLPEVGEPTEAGRVPGSAGLAELAAGYRSELAALQPHGPYRLGGWSMGALLAYELARQLEADGEAVELLLMLDPPFAMPTEHSTPEELAEYFVADSLRTVGAPVSVRHAQSVSDHLDNLAAVLDTGPGTQMRAEVARRFDAFRAHRAALSGYRPAGSVRARTVLIGADRSPNRDAQQEWLALLPHAERHGFDADHYTLLQAGLVQHIARLVEKVEIDADTSA
jgi:amino acid adenylation domain-containing protein